MRKRQGQIPTRLLVTLGTIAKHIFIIQQNQFCLSSFSYEYPHQSPSDEEKNTKTCDSYYGGAIVNRTCGTPKNVDVSLFLLIIFGSIYCGPS